MDYKTLEDLLKDTSRNPNMFMDYLVEYSDIYSEYTCLNEYEDKIRLFKDFALPLKHTLAVTTLEIISKNRPTLVKKKLSQFKTRYKNEIEEELSNMDNILCYLADETEYGIAPRNKIILVNIDNNITPNENMWDNVREKAFPIELKKARDFVEIFKETLNDMIYLTYKLGGRDRLVEYDSDESHNLAEWVLRKRNYDFLCGEYSNVDTLSFRMWEIIDQKTKQGLFD